MTTHGTQHSQYGYYEMHSNCNVNMPSPTGGLCFLANWLRHHPDVSSVFLKPFRRFTNPNPFALYLDQEQRGGNFHPDLVHGFPMREDKTEMVEDRQELTELRSKVHIIKFKKEIRHQVTQKLLDLNVNEDVVAVHIRMTDHNQWKGHGSLNLLSYIREIEKHKGNILVASDNYESVDKLRQIYGTRILTQDIYRFPTEVSTAPTPTCIYPGEVEDAFNTPGRIIESMVELLTLARCNYFIGRPNSNFSRTIAILGHMPFENITWLNPFVDKDRSS